MATALENTGPAQYLDLNQMPKPPVGLEIADHVLVDFTPQKPAANGSYAYGVGIFRALTTDPLAYHRYVVWTLILRPEGDQDVSVWLVEQGDYCRSLGEALHAYERRGGTID